jgi:uncharacterized Zn finger protein
MKHWETYSGARALPAPGGIKAQNRDFAAQWWSRLWLDCLDRLCDKGRLSRGRTYARRGQVTNLVIERESVRASVQGSRRQPYDVELTFRGWSEAQAQRVQTELIGRVALASQLLAGTMPEELECLLQEMNLSLFPKERGEVSTDCSCPDWGDPCKHGAAVYCLLTEEIDRDPWILLGLRGVDRDEWLGALGLSSEEVDEPEPLETEGFWSRGGVPSFEFGRIPRQAAAPVKMLGNFPFWRGQRAFLPALEELYGELSEAALRRAEDLQ